mmetsp:Transcript_57735/g.129477  ORF Transcript_57735/g.129477 Transcript_57735/m.129477 type:complete len:93 (+) Transcript_57735:380-658(+)
MRLSVSKHISLGCIVNGSSGSSSSNLCTAKHAVKKRQTLAAPYSKRVARNQARQIFIRSGARRRTVVVLPNVDDKSGYWNGISVWFSIAEVQ